ncbi:hypothetical protein SAMN05661012_05733 [Chitinophaga sancti]|uniref:Uncharacterized protein n=1 Tax=Chitinophaga sancti TaxID=1004 RepID=A0A1K1SM62_9BACT|nr:hypothetical protein SAMN05661012_05733 [Chitinophaga sancti]
MRSAIIAYSDQFIPLAYTLARQGQQVCIFPASQKDAILHRIVAGFNPSVSFCTFFIHYAEGCVKDQPLIKRCCTASLFFAPSTLGVTPLSSTNLFAR